MEKLAVKNVVIIGAGLGGLLAGVRLKENVVRELH